MVRRATVSWRLPAPEGSASSLPSVSFTPATRSSTPLAS